MFKINNSKAFSLIELSIVILIIGILVAGVTQSSRLVSRMKLLSVRSLTMNSPVPTIKDLYSWHETTSEASFDEIETSDGSTLTNWYDLNPQVSSGKVNFLQANAGQRPVYRSSAINGFAGVYFDGGKFLYTDINTPSVLGAGSATFFFVFRPQNAYAQSFLITQTYSTCANNIEIGHTTGNQAGANFGIHSGCNRATVTPPNILSNNTTSLMTMVLSSSQIVNGGTANVKIFKDGGSELTLYADAGGYNSGLNGSYAVGNYNLYMGVRYDWRNTLNAYFAGTISEVIIYSRSLNAEERQAVEKYLGKKWGLKIT